MSKSDDHPDGSWQVPDPLRSSDDRPGSASDGAAATDTDRTGSRTAAASDVDGDVPLLWSTVRGRLLMIAVSVSMLASVVVLTAWVCLR